jgi:hypothetical protein
MGAGEAADIVYGWKIGSDEEPISNKYFGCKKCRNKLNNNSNKSDKSDKNDKWCKKCDEDGDDFNDTFFDNFKLLRITDYNDILGYFVAFKYKRTTCRYAYDPDPSFTYNDLQFNHLNMTQNDIKKLSKFGIDHDQYPNLYVMTYRTDGI